MSEVREIGERFGRPGLHEPVPHRLQEVAGGKARVGGLSVTSCLCCKTFFGEKLKKVCSDV